MNTAARPGGKNKDGVDRGDGRDHNGKYANGNNGKSGKAAEKDALDKKAAETNNPIIREQKQATLPKESGATQTNRYYDGLQKNSDGTYTGYEVKSGSARLTPGQRSFDEAVNNGHPATVQLPSGEFVKITRVLYLDG